MLNNFNLEEKSSEKLLTLINQVKELNKETDKKISEIRQNSFLKKVNTFKKYKDDWDQLLKEALNKPCKYNENISDNSKFEQIQKVIQIDTENKARKIKEELDIINTNLEKCRNYLEINNILPTQIKSFQQLLVLKSNLEIILKQEIISEDDLLISKSIKEQVITLSDHVQLQTQKILHEQELKSKELEEKKIKENLEKKKLEKEIIEKERIEKTNNIVEEYLDGFYNKTDFELYINLRKFNIELKDSLNDFVSNEKYKVYRTNLSQFVKTTINTISCNSFEHLMDKVKRLSTLFEQKNFTFKNSNLSTRDHKDALVYSMNQAAKSFLSVGIKQVLSSTKSSYSLAATITILWSNFPLFGKILLAEFYEVCPYLLPYFPVRETNEDETEFLIICGYSLTKNGTLEEESVFLNKMRALVILFAAIIQTNYKKNFFGLANGWKWLAKILNMNPVNTVNPAIIHSFLSIADFRMHQIYGKQFIKLIYYIHNIYLPKIADLNLSNKQPGQQLKNYIENLIKKFKYNQNIEEPLGFIKFLPEFH